jgi:O-antigen ligase
VLNVGILTFTGTRGAVGVGIMAVVCFVLTGVANVRRVTVLDVGYGLAVLLLSFYVLGWGLPNLLRRNIGIGEAGLNTSGRVTGWDYFWNVAMTSPWFGRGLGAGSVASEGVLSGFSVPHNEYLRFIVDGGGVGLLIMLAGYGAAFQQVLSRKGEASRGVLVVVMVCVAVYAFVDNTFSTAQFTVPLWLFFGIVRQEAPPSGGL